VELLTMLRKPDQRQHSQFRESVLVSSEEEPPAALSLLPLPPPTQLDSLIVSSFPPLFDEFRGKRFVLLWRGNRDGFGAQDFHGRCDGHANTLTLILDTGGNVFGGFTPLQWDSSNRYKWDDSLMSFFTLKNPDNTPTRKFALKAEKNHLAINCNAPDYPRFGSGWEIALFDNCNANTDSGTFLGRMFTNDTGLNGNRVFTNLHNFQMREI
jgi:hypothetical protein